MREGLEDGPRIAITAPVFLNQRAIEVLQDISSSPVVLSEAAPRDEAELIQRIGNSNIILGPHSLSITRQVLDDCPSVRYIGVCGTNLSGIDLEAARARGIIVTNATNYCESATAEFIFTQLFMLARGIGRNRWKNEPCEIAGKTMGIIGLGAVGQEVAKRALGNEMKVLYYSPTRRLEWEEKGVQYAELLNLLGQSEVISIHIPKDATVLSKAEFKQIPDGRVLVNTSMGDGLDVDALAKWLSNEGNFVVMDGIASPEYHQRLSGFPNAILSPKISAYTQETRDRLSRQVLGKLRHYIDFG